MVAPHCTASSSVFGQAACGVKKPYYVCKSRARQVADSYHAHSRHEIGKPPKARSSAATPQRSAPAPFETRGARDIAARKRNARPTATTTTRWHAQPGQPRRPVSPGQHQGGFGKTGTPGAVRRQRSRTVEIRTAMQRYIKPGRTSS
jgi:hypothetical protein